MFGFYGSIENEGIGSLGIYYEKIANKLEAGGAEEEEKRAVL